MQRTVIDIFSKGNQELFHSAFLAWLMDARGEHGMGDGFLRELVSLLGERSGITLEMPTSYRIATEHRVSRGRLDIIVLAEGDDGSQAKGLVFENKTKAFGEASQLDKYSAEGFAVCAVALLPETLSRDVRSRYPVITYAEIADLIRRRELKAMDHYHFLMAEYARFIEFETEAFDALRSFVKGEDSPESLRKRWGRLFSQRTLTDNDVRTLNYFYYHLLIEWIESVEPDLILGEQGYNDHGANTRWLAEKNKQGPAFMEAILGRGQSDSGRFVLTADLARFLGEPGAGLAPRIEVWLDPTSIIDGLDPEVGLLMLGGWGQGLRRALATTDALAGRLVRRGPRNFHHERIGLTDLPLDRMAGKLRSALKLLGDFREG